LFPLTIAQLYRARWQVELSFRWIKQHLHIKVFDGTSVNAVKSQVWIALSVYLLVTILKKQLGSTPVSIKSCKFSVLRFSKKPHFHRVSSTSPMKLKVSRSLSSFIYLSFNRTVLI